MEAGLGGPRVGGGIPGAAIPGGFAGIAELLGGGGVEIWDVGIRAVGCGSRAQLCSKIWALWGVEFCSSGGEPGPELHGWAGGAAPTCKAAARPRAGIPAQGRRCQAVPGAGCCAGPCWVFCQAVLGAGRCAGCCAGCWVLHQVPPQALPWLPEPPARLCRKQPGDPGPWRWGGWVPWLQSAAPARNRRCCTSLAGLTALPSCRDFLPRGSGIVTRRPLILQLIFSKTGTALRAASPHGGRWAPRCSSVGSPQRGGR